MLFSQLKNTLKRRAIAISVVFTSLFSVNVWACCERETFNIPHQTEAPTLDGKLLEAQWKNATVIELKYENNPGEGIPAPVKTVAYLYEDGDSLHVAIVAYDPNPEAIRGYLRDRDTLWNDDNVGIIIDTFNDERSGYEFFVNPLGAQADMRMTDTNGWNEDASWDAIWDSVAEINEEGWIVEMSIPFRAIRFPETKQELQWNIAVWRNYPRDVRHQMASFKSDRNLECNLCQFDKIVGFTSVEAGNNFQLTPTLTLGRTDKRDENFDDDTQQTEFSDWQNGDVNQEVGLDLRWGISQDMVLNATINPDFSQVEADSGQLDVNNTFSLFTQEKRPFFLDGADYFDTNSFNFVHTRNIADPDYGVKLTGKSNEHTYGLLVANDNNTAFILPGNQGSNIADLETDSTVSIARYKVDIGERNNIGGLITNRQTDDYRNTLASIDGNYWISQEDSLQYQFAFSQSKNSEELMDDFSLTEKQSDYAYALHYSHSTRDYNINVSYRDVGEDFRADMGFNTQANFKKLVAGGRRNYYGEKDDFFTRWGYFGDWDISYDQDGNKLEQEIEFHGNLQGPMQFFSNFGVVARERFYDGGYKVDDEVDVGEIFDELQFMAYAQITPASGVRLQTFTRFGKQIDFANRQLGDVFVLEGTIEWQIGKHFSVETSQNYNALEVDGGNLYTANLTDMRLSYQFDIQSQLKLVIQYTDIDRNTALYMANNDEDTDNDYNKRSKSLSSQLIYSYKINPQTLFYLGYSDGGYQTDDFDRIEKDNRTIFAKFSYAWQG